MQSEGYLLAIANTYGNVDVCGGVPKGYCHVPGKRIELICKRLGIKWAKALIGFKGKKKYGYSPELDGVVISVRSKQKLLQALAERDAKATTPAATEARKRARLRREEKAQEARSKLLAAGIDPDGRVAQWLRSGEMTMRQAKLAAFKANYRHNFTDYDEVLHGLRGQEDARDTARALRTEDPIPDNWDEYLAEYGFSGSIADALAKTLANPTKYHPIWFYEAMLAVEEFMPKDIPLHKLTYELIRDCIERGRAQDNVS